MSLACLPWYDLVETQEVTDRLWRLVARELKEQNMLNVPDELDRRADYEAQWKSADLLLGQACGYDVYCANDHNLQIIGVPLYDMPGCEGTRYRSFVIVRDDSSYSSIEDLRGARCVINSPRSHSGMNVLRALVAPLAQGRRFFESVQISGAHERSLDLVRLRRADVAAIDCITYGLLMRHRPEAIAPTRIVHHTQTLTAPPYVTGANTSVRVQKMIFQALERGIAALSQTDLAQLGLHGIASASMEDYQGIGEMSAHAWDEHYTDMSQSSEEDSESDK